MFLEKIYGAIKYNLCRTFTMVQVLDTVGDCYSTVQLDSVAVNLELILMVCFAANGHGIYFLFNLLSIF